MSTNVHYLLIPSFPFEPSEGQFVFVECGYHRQFNDFLKKYDASDERFVSLPSIEHSFYYEKSVDEFFDTILPEISDLYTFLDGATLGIPHNIQKDVNSNTCHFQVTTKNINTVVEYGVMTYTGLELAYEPIFAYTSLVADSADQIASNLDNAVSLLQSACKQLTPEGPCPKNLLHLVQVVGSGFKTLERKPRCIDYFVYRNGIKYNWANVDCDTSTSRDMNAPANCNIVFKSRNKVYNVTFTPAEFALYSVLAFAGEYKSQNELFGNRFYNDILQPIWTNLLHQKGTCRISESSLLVHIKNIENKIKDTLIREDNPDYHKPFVISYIEDKKHPYGAYGILIFAHSKYKRYYSAFTEKIEAAIATVYSDPSHTILKSCPISLNGTYHIINGVNVISGLAFSNCKSLTHISIPESVRVINSRAFYGCDKLACVEFNNPACGISPDIFEKCPKLGCFIFPASLSNSFTFSRLRELYPNIAIKVR